MKIDAIRKEKEMAAEFMLRTQFQMELTVYTQDSTYSKFLEEQYAQEQKNNALLGVPKSRVNFAATMKEMMKHLKSYFQVSVVEILSFQLVIIVHCNLLV